MNGLRPEIRQGMGYPEIRQFPVLVNKSQVYNEECRARFTHFQNLTDKKSEGNFGGKSYVTSADKGKRKASYEGRLSGEGVYPNPIRCYKCGGIGHRAYECLFGVQKCFNCGLTGHVVEDCRSEIPTCYNCGELGHQMFECLKAVMPYARRCYKCDGLGHKMHECEKGGIGCFRCGRTGHVATDCKAKVVTCYNCGELGHVRNRCRKAKQVQVGGKALVGTGSQSASADR